MDLKQLEYFVRVANTGSYTRASSRLGVDQPALSKQVRRLEVELKQALFERHGRGVTLTEGGKLVLGHARKVLDAVAELRNAVDASRKEVYGKVVIATPATTRKALTDFISAFKARFPRAVLEILEARSNLIYEWLLEGRVDIGILHDVGSARGIETTPVLDQPLYLISRPDMAPVRPSAELPFKALARLPLILPSQVHSIRTLVEAQAARLRIGLRVVLQVEGGQLILDLVRQGHGHAILPASSISLSGVAGPLQLNEIVQPRLMRAFSLAVAANRPATRLCKETRKLLEQHLGGGTAARGRSGGVTHA